MSKLSSLDKLLKRFEDAAAEVQYLESAEPEFRAEIEKLLSELGSINPRFFVLTDAVCELPPEQAARLTRLESLRGKLGLLPGVIGRCEAKLSALKEELGEAIEVEILALRKIAVGQRDQIALDAEVEAKKLSPLRYAVIARELVIDSVPNRAVETMKCLSRDLAAAARQVIEVRKSLESPETAANLTPAGK